MTGIPRPDITLDQWVALCAVIDCGGVHAAARAIHRSHSAVSQTLLKLQDRLGVRLFVQDGRRLSPTTAGVTAGRLARRLVDRAAEIEQHCRVMAEGWEPEIRVAIDAVVGACTLADALSAFEPQSRGSRVKVTREVSTGAARAALDVNIDVVVTSALPAGVDPNPVATAAFVAVAAPHHPLASAEHVTGDDLARARQIVIGDTSPAACADRGTWLRSELRWTVPDFEIARALLATGLAFCFAPRALVASELAERALVELLGPEQVVQLPIHVVLPKHDATGPCARAFAGVLARALGHPLEG